MGPDGATKQSSTFFGAPLTNPLPLIEHKPHKD
jgi:hypothetical protein